VAVRGAHVIAAVLLSLAGGCSRVPAETVAVATTTSVISSGLMEELQPLYREAVHATIRAIPVGSGRALKMLEQSQADAAITHAPAQEATMLRLHPSWRYRKVFYNRFVIVGPPDDPAGAAGARDAADAMRRIAKSPARFVSRGDESGTHERERQLWAAAGVTPPTGRLVIAGAGMADTLRIASETTSYTLTDENTLHRLVARLALRTVSAGDPVLLNTYAVIAEPGNARGHAFAQWLAVEGRQSLEKVLSTGRLPGRFLWPGHRPNGAPTDLPF
jgi:tungstate transport system substrate-binding protein